MSKFTLYDYLGRPKARYVVEEQVLAADPNATRPGTSHHIIVADASGSMGWDISAVKQTIEKLLTLEEYKDSSLLVSLLTYSSEGDVATHFSRIKVSEVMRPGSRYVEEIRRIRTRGMTCMSQGLVSAKALVQAGETTCVTLHSDGWANDRSPGSERRVIDTIIEEFRKMPGVFVNTIAYRDYSDFKLLSYIANACSGTCFQTPTVKELFDALHQTSDLLQGQVAPSLDLAIGQSDYQVFASVAARKVLGSAKDSTVLGVKSSDDRIVYRYRRVEAEAYESDTSPICGEGANLNAVLAFARTQIAEGNLNAAKYALVSTRNTDLITKHARALTSTEIAAMASDIEGALFDAKSGTMSSFYGLPDAHEMSVLGVLGLLADGASDITIDLTSLTKGYKRRGVKRITGSRQEDGTVTKPWVKTAFRDGGDWAQVSSFDLNRNNATVNMLVTREINLVKADDDTVIPEVAGVRLNELKSFNNYTMVGDGVLNVTGLSVKIANKRLFRSLVAAKVLPDSTFDPKAVYDIRLEGRPLVAYDATFEASALDGVFDRLARMKVLSSILSACMKDKSDAYTEEQVSELKRHFLSPALYLSLPTTNEYADLKQALADGIVDTRVSYKVDIGSSKILNLGEFHSGNKFLDRMFTVKIGGGDVEKKPNMMMRWDAKGVTYGYKTLSGRTQLGPVDDVMKPIFEEFLGLAVNGSLIDILDTAKIGDDAFKTRFVEAAHGKLGTDDTVEVFTDVRWKLDNAIESAYRAAVSPLVFYVGATGLLPDEFNAKALTAEAIKERYPELTGIGKNEADATFFDVNGTIITIFAKPEYFSTGHGATSDVEAAA